MKTTRLGILLGAICLELTISSPVWATTAIVKSISNIKNVGIATNQANPTDTGPVTTTATLDGASTTIDESSTTVNDTSTTTNANSSSRTKTINISRSNIKNNLPVNINVDPTEAGPVTTTTTLNNTSTESISKHNLTTRDVSLLNNNQLESTVSGNTTTADAKNPDCPTGFPGNSIGANAFTGTSGVTVVNMNDGANSSLQNSVTVIAIPSLNALR